MCGIYGYIGRSGNPDGHGGTGEPCGDAAAAMRDVMVHRGPDGEGVWRDPEAPVCLGHLRLAIIDLSGGAQPMRTAEEDLVVTFNGEIYNHGQLRDELRARGHRFRTDHSDTEVLLHGYREWGEALPEKLNGMWAFAIWDRTRRRLFISRDRFGKKPLFYAATREAFVFGSELRAVAAHPATSTSLSTLALKKYFAFGYIPAPHTIYQSVRKLPGGHSLTIALDDAIPTVRQYWDYRIEPFETIPKDPDAEWGGRLLELLDAAVKRRLMSDVPLGVFLSGGVDSSAITALAARHMTGGLKTFSIGFTEASFDESVPAKRVAEHFGTDHTCETLSMEKALELAPRIAAMLDEPMGDSSLLPTYLLCGVTRKRVTVALGGDGGDELFAGYDPFVALRYAELYNKLTPKPVHEAIRMAASLVPVSHRNMSLDFKVKRTLRGLSYPRPLWNPIWLGPLAPTDLEDLFREPTDPEAVYEEAINAWEGAGCDHVVDKTLYFYTKLYLQDDILVKVDRASMLHSLEARSPFLDVEVADFARRIPWRWKHRKGVGKHILKQALEGLVPHDIIHRKKKGFGAPIGKWFAEGRLHPTPPVQPMPMDWSETTRRFANHRAGRCDERAFLWNAWLLGAWGGVR